MKATIRQFNQVIVSWSISTSTVTDALRQEAEAKATTLKQNGKLKTGYYDLEITYRGRVLDSEALIA